MNGRLKQAVVGLVVVSSVSAVGASVTLSQLQGANRIRRAVQSNPKKAEPAVARVASETVAPKAASQDQASVAKIAAENLTSMESASLERVARTHRVRLNNGSITGAIQVVEPGGAIRNLSDVKVSFFQNGMLVTQVTPGLDGVFTATMAPGVYTLVAYGPSGYVAYGVQAVDPTVQIRSAGLETVSNELQAVLDVESLAVPPVDFAAVYGLARTYAAAAVVGPVPTRADSPAERLPDLPTEDALPQTNIKQHTVFLEADGSLLGRLTRIHPTTGDLLRIHSLNAFLVKNGAVVAQTGVAEDGSLKFSAVAPGTYSFVTAGAEGFSAFSVVVAAPVATASNNTLQPVSFMQGGGGLTGTPAPPSDIPAATAPLAPPPGDPNDPLGPLPPAPGGGGGGFGGGGGGFGGGGAGGGGGFGLGGLLGLAGIGLGAAALIDDNDDNNNPVSPAGP